MVEVEVVYIWIQQVMLKYSRKLSQGQGRVHEYNTISHNVEGELTSLVLYLLQDGTAWEIVQEGCLLCNRIPNLPQDL